MSTCPKCQSMSFTVQQQTPSGSNYKLLFVQCALCGAVVGVMDYWNIGAKIVNLEKKIVELDSKMSNILNALQMVFNELRRR